MMNLSTKKKLFWYWSVFAFLLVALVFIRYYGLVKYHYIAPAGDDPVAHYNMAKPFYDNTKSFLETWKNGLYPPLYHYAIAHIALVFKTDLLATMNLTYPSIIVFASLSVFVCAYFLFGSFEALVAFFLYGFTAKSSIQLLFDGGYPNLIAAHILLPIFVLFYVKIFLSSKLKQQLLFLSLSSVTAVLIVLIHHITTFYLLGIVGLSLPFILIWKWITAKWSVKKGILFTLIFVLIYSLVIYAFFNTSLFAPARSLYMYSTSNFDPNGMWLIDYYPDGIGKSVYYFGIMGLFLLAIKFIIRFKDRINITFLVLFIWSLLLFVVSRFQIANPERPARDLVVPLAICSGVAIAILIRHFKNNYLTSVLIIILLLFSVAGIKERVSKAIHYEPMMRMTPADEQAIDYIKSQPVGSILSNEVNGYLPIFLNNVTFNSKETINPAIANSYKYLLLVDKQSGWVPAGNYVGIYKNINDLPFKKIKTFSSDTRTVSLYQNTLP